MEICEGEKSICLELQEDGTLYVEWCDGLTRGVREMTCPEKYGDELRRMLQRAVQNVGAKETFSPDALPLRVEASHPKGYVCVKAAYVPEEDLLPWQWVEAEDICREAEAAAWIRTL